jgi:hypothetical protein
MCLRSNEDDSFPRADWEDIIEKEGAHRDLKEDNAGLGVGGKGQHGQAAHKQQAGAHDDQQVISDHILMRHFLILYLCKLGQNEWIYNLKLAL